MSKAECECGVELQPEELYKLHEDQQATMMDILSENRKKEYPESVRELLKLEERMLVQGVCYVINRIPKFI
jgi:hypothetical protein